MDVAGTKSARAEGRVSRKSVRKKLVGRRQDKQIRAHHGEHMEPINVVLVHGAWADGSSWSKVIPPQQTKGFNVTSAQIPLKSIEDDVVVTKRLLSAQGGPTVLVGHSYGGVVVSVAANGSPNVKALVYIAAFGLDEGESIEALGKTGPAPAGAAQIRPDANGFLWINREGFAQAFASDVDPIQARVMAAGKTHFSVLPFAGKGGAPAWKNIPSWYMVATKAQMIPPQAEEFMAKRMRATMRTVPSSHAAMVSHPKAVTDLIISAPESTAKSSVGLPV